jgi:1-acyl-sn-glycerol-3-phosphate acyltransferase
VPTESLRALLAPIVDRPLAPGPWPRLACWLLRAAGWTIRLRAPIPRKCVAIFYPHTSNWDTIIGLLAKAMLGLRIHFVGKDTLFRWPLGSILVAWGGIPVNRREPTGFVGGIEREFARRDDFVLALAPEGTRRRTECWKSGFYRLARAARVPLALGYIDYVAREIGIGAYVEVSDDCAADMAQIRAFYEGRTGRHPEFQGPIRLREEPRAGP